MTTFDRESFIEACREATEESAAPTAVRDVVARAVSDPAAILADLGEPTTAGFDAIHRSDDLTILNFRWAPLMNLLPHDHNDIWAVIGLYSGREDSIFWRRTADSIEAAGAEALGEGDATVLGPSVIHSVLNPIPRMTLALHVYGGDFFADGRREWDPETLAERPFDVEASARGFEAASRRFEQA